MGSLSRKLKRHLTWTPPKQAAAVAPGLAEGMLLSQRLERAARDNNAADPLHFLEYLRRMRRGYDPKVDGPSHLMKLVDEINKFEKEELARRAAAAEGAKG